MATGFTVENWKLKVSMHPVEDTYSIDRSGKIFAVADGITRDPAEYLPNIKSPIGKLKFAMQYPRPSPARIASRIFTQTFPLVLRDYCFWNRDEESIKKAFEEANKRIGNWNRHNGYGLNYTLRDFAGCVASGALINQDTVFWGYLTDCGVAIFDENGNLRFRTENQGPTKYDKEIWKDERLQQIGWRDPEARTIVRRDYRNNLKEPNSFGALTGEEQAMHYVRTGVQETKPGEVVIVYSDGLEDIILSEEFSNKLKKGNVESMRKLCKKRVRTEGTLIHHLHRDWREEMKAEARSARFFDLMSQQIAYDNGFTSKAPTW